MGPRWWRSLVMLVGVVLVATGCAALQQQASNSPESSPTTSAESATPSTAPIRTATPSTTPTGSKPALLTITSASFHAGEVGIAYAPVTLSAKGGVPPYTWTISVGALPSGLMAASGGSVSGTPTSVGTFAFTVHVADTASGSAIVNRSIVVARHLTATSVCTTAAPCAVEAGCVTVCGKFGTLAGGVGPLSYMLAAGAIPTGMGRSGLSLTGAFPAPATRGGSKTWLFTINITDAIGVVAAVPANFFVFSHIAFSASSYSCDASITTGCTARLPYTLGTPGLATPNVKVAVLSTTPSPMVVPPGYTYSVTARSGIVTVSFPVVGCGAYQFLHVWVLSLVLVDQSQCSASAKCASAPAKVTVTLQNTC